MVPLSSKLGLIRRHKKVSVGSISLVPDLIFVGHVDGWRQNWQLNE
jgi:hypothetical protein